MPAPSDRPRSHREPPPRGPAALGTLLLVGGGLLGVLRFVEALTGLPFSMPDSWYGNSAALWYGVALALFLAGIAMLRDRPAPDIGWRPTRPGPRFRRVAVYTRKDCPLCDDALEILAGYQRWMPAIDEIDIDEDPALVERFTTCVPVVEIDGRVRFRGRVNEILLRRMIEGAPPVDTEPGPGLL